MNVQQKKGSYHHGALRRALLDAALQLATERGLGGFTLREVARQAGVSHAAPYYHFADKAALIEALAVEQFTALHDALQDARTRTDGSPLEQLRATGVAYVRFAVEHVAAFRFMYWPELRRPSGTRQSQDLRREAPLRFWKREGKVEEAANAAYQVLVDAIVVCQQAGLIAPGDPAPLALTAWCTVHGLAALLLNNPPDEQEEVGTQAERMARVVTWQLSQGLLAR